VPGGHAPAGLRVLERLVLEPGGVQPQLAPHGQQALPIGTHEVGHRLTVEAMAVKPDAAVKGVAHALAAAWKLPITPPYWQVILPSTVALPTGVAPPENR